MVWPEYSVFFFDVYALSIVAIKTSIEYWRPFRSYKVTEKFEWMM